MIVDGDETPFNSNPVYQHGKGNGYPKVICTEFTEYSQETVRVVEY